MPTIVHSSVADTARAVGAQVETRLRARLGADRARYDRAGRDGAEAHDALLSSVLAGGKRMRPTLAVLAFAAAGGRDDDPRVLDLAAAVELLHTGLLVHDDVMDDSPTRRGVPTTHTVQEERHRLLGWRGEPRRYAEGVAGIVGDIAFFTVLGLLRDAGPVVLDAFSAMAVDTAVGQYLDLLASARPENPPDPMVIARYKTGGYSVEGPLRLGLALADGGGALGGVFADYGRPVGLAYQLRDDVLGVFGDPAETGKPVGDDLLQGKQTLLLDEARRRVPAQASAARALLDAVTSGTLTPGEVPALQRLLVDTGALDHVESVCADLVARAVAVVDAAPVPPVVRENLRQLARHFAVRNDTLPVSPVPRHSSEELHDSFTGG